MTLKSVVLPAPFGPMIPWIAPALTTRLASSTALSPPKACVTRSSVSTGLASPAGFDATAGTAATRGIDGGRRTGAKRSRSFQ